MYADEVQVSLSKVDGGYIIHLPNGTTITASLDKALELIRLVMTPEVTE